MTDGGLTALMATAASVGVIHTLMGPDHYVPFIAMSRAGRWSLRKTMTVAALCGVAHVLSSAVLGACGVAAGWSLGLLASIEATRGDIAGWMLVGFGLAYTAWGLRRAVRNRPHAHWHLHADGTLHRHVHVHEFDHVHVHAPATSDARSAPAPAEGRPGLTGWAVFTIFVFGACEPLIPLMMAPAALGRWADVVAVTAVFGATTLAGMLVMILLGLKGLAFVPLSSLQRYAHAGAGLAVTACGVAVKLGL